MILRILNPMIFLIALVSLVGCTPEAKNTQNPPEENQGSHTHDEHESGHADHPEGHHEAKAVTTPYPLANCPVTEATLGSMGEPVIERIDGREVQFCCSNCPEKFRSNRAEYSTKMDEAIISAQSADYPLDVCVVSGEALGGDHGEPIDIVVENRMFRVCCKSCISDIEFDSSDFVAVLDDAIVGKSASIPTKSHADSEAHEHEHD